MAGSRSIVFGDVWFDQEHVRTPRGHSGHRLLNAPHVPLIIVSVLMLKRNGSTTPKSFLQGSVGRLIYWSVAIVRGRWASVSMIDCDYEGLKQCVMIFR